MHEFSANTCTNIRLSWKCNDWKWMNVPFLPGSLRQVVLGHSLSTNLAMNFLFQARLRNITQSCSFWGKMPRLKIHGWSFSSASFAAMQMLLVSCNLSTNLKSQSHVQLFPFLEPASIFLASFPGLVTQLLPSYLSRGSCTRRQRRIATPPRPRIRTMPVW